MTFSVAKGKNLLKLKAYGLASVREVDDLPLVPRELPKWIQSFFVRVEGKLIWIDTWDYEHPVGEWIKGQGPDLDVHCVLKIQYRANTIFPGARQVRIYPWTMFHTDHTSWLRNQPKYRKMYAESEKKHNAGCTGKAWKTRKTWFNHIESMDGVFCRKYSSRARVGSTPEYIKMLCEWRSVICLMGKRGRFTDGKNRREVECASIGIPMILNYKPSYLNPLKNGEHYLYVGKPKHIAAAIEKLQDKEFAEDLAAKAFAWWKRNASEKGICKTFMQVMEKSGAV